MKLGDFAEQIGKEANRALGRPGIAQEGFASPWELVKMRAIRGTAAAKTAAASWRLRAPSSMRKYDIKERGVKSDKAIADAVENQLKKLGKPMKFKDPETGIPSFGYRVKSVFVEKLSDFAYDFYTWRKAKAAFKLGESREMKLTDLITEGEFGPGSPSNPVRVPSPAWKANMGTIENKRRPESLYITMSTWVKPKLSVTTASALGSADPEDVAIAAAKELDAELRRMRSKLPGFFNSLYFDVDSIIFTYDFAYEHAAPGKAQFLELEINVDTVNTIDADDRPAPNPKTGKVEMLHLDAFKKPVADAVAKILQQQMFARSANLDFQKTKRR